MRIAHGCVVDRPNKYLFLPPSFLSSGCSSFLLRLLLLRTAGEFQLLVKVYPDGVVSGALDALPIGGEMEFKHIKFNVKLP